ncbi:MAG: RNA-directed DNA polymerase [Clostridiales bacterium]|nr:RNA-directed DNA polymerase [Clostridiales bacterium]
MNSIERHEARYQRRKKARDKKRFAQVKDALDYTKVFSFPHMYRSAQQCYKGVDWKASVQAHQSRCGIKVAKKCEELELERIRMGRCPEFTIRERGHERTINSIGINDRVPQKCNSKYALKPVLHRSLIYDNYASQENKGTALARKRFKKMLVKHIRKYGLTGGVIVADIHHFFDSIQHEEVRKLLKKNFDDERIINFNMKVIATGKRLVGLVLGSENSQDFAVSVPNSLDHYITDVLRVEGYGRYMDDMIIIDADYDYLKIVFEKVKDFASGIGFLLNEKKCRLVRFGRQFTILKRKYDFTKTGHIIIRPTRDSVIRERRKLKRLGAKAIAGKIPFQTVYDSFQSWKASIADTKCYQIVQSITELFQSIFIEYWVAQTV